MDNLYIALLRFLLNQRENCNIFLLLKMVKIYQQALTYCDIPRFLFWTLLECNLMKSFVIKKLKIYIS